jgi:hypothetical protein
VKYILHKGCSIKYILHKGCYIKFHIFRRYAECLCIFIFLELIVLKHCSSMATNSLYLLVSEINSTETECEILKYHLISMVFPLIIVIFVSYLWVNTENFLFLSYGKRGPNSEILHSSRLPLSVIVFEVTWLQ